MTATATLIARRAAAAAHDAANTAATEATLIAAIQADEDQTQVTLIGGRVMTGTALIAAVRRVREARIDRDLSYWAQTILNKHAGQDGSFAVCEAYAEAARLVMALADGEVARLVA